MNQIEAFTTLIDAARQLPENKQLTRAIKVAEKMLQRRQAKKDRAIQDQARFKAALDFLCEGADVRYGGWLGKIIQCNPVLDVYLVRLEDGQELTLSATEIQKN